jgi:nicotinamide mononucleotide transporter
VNTLLTLNDIFFTLLGYPMSYLEFFGTVFSLLSVWLMTRTSLWAWPTGLVGVVLFGLIFYQIRLYADFLEQVYYFGACLYGWWLWSRKKENQHTRALETGFSSSYELWLHANLTLVGGAFLSAFLVRANTLFPAAFPEPASYPWVDGLTTAMSVTAMILSARKRTENWVYWIVVNVASVWLYWVKDVKFVALLYLVYLALAVAGLIAWGKTKQNDTGAEAPEGEVLSA